MKNILVFFGGQSVERDVSVITGVLTANSIDKEKFNPVPIFVAPNGKWYTGKSLFDIEFYKNLDYKKLSEVFVKGGDNALYVTKKNRCKKLLSISVAINCIHGEKGEDGSLTGYLKMCDIPLASPDMFSSSAFMDKEFTKIVLKGINVPTLPFCAVNSTGCLDNVEEKLSFPVIVKPATLGSSIGIKVAKNRKELIDATAFAFRFCNKVVVEPFIEGFTEINVAVYRDRKGVHVSECEQPLTKNDLLDFEDKYTDGEKIFPANISKNLSDRIKKIAKTVYSRTQTEGIIRIDFIVKENKVFVNEVNTVPGSLSYYLFSDTMKEFSLILERLIEKAEERYAKEKTLIKTFSSSILNIKGAKGVKHL